MRWVWAALPPLAIGLMWALSSGDGELEACAEQLAQALVGQESEEVQTLRAQRDALLAECVERGC